jgi:F-type H+-transporting ATPase subunit a
MATEKAVEHTVGEEMALTEHVAEESHEKGIHIALSPEGFGSFAGIPVTNTLLMSLVVSVLLMGLAYRYGSRLATIPGRVQAFFEMVVEGAFDFIARTLGDEGLARKYFPLITTVFLFIATANILHFVPGIGSITLTDLTGYDAGVLRSMNTDLNVTLALTIIAVLTIEFAGVAALGFWRYTGKFINFSSPVNFIVGLIELVSEVARLVSFSFRLFGNIFAGKVLMAVVLFFVPYFVPVPLMMFEIFVGVLQGLIFAMLLLFFIKMAVTDPHEAH